MTDYTETGFFNGNVYPILRGSDGQFYVATPLTDTEAVSHIVAGYQHKRARRDLADADRADDSQLRNALHNLMVGMGTE